MRCSSFSRAVSDFLAMPVRKQKGTHFSPAELALMNKLQKQKPTPDEIFKTIVAGRKKRGKCAAPNISTVYRYLRGETHLPDDDEQRGSDPKLGETALKVYDQVRRNLQKAAGNDYVVTWADIAEAGERALRRKKMLKRGPEGWCADHLRKKMRSECGVGKRPAPARIGRTPED